MRLIITVIFLLILSHLKCQINFTFSSSYSFNNAKANFQQDLDAFWERNIGTIRTVHIIHKPKRGLFSRNLQFRSSIILKDKHEIYISYENMRAGLRSEFKQLPIIRNNEQDFGEYQTVYQNYFTSVSLGYSRIFKLNDQIKLRLAQDFIFSLYKRSTYVFNYKPENGEVLSTPPAQASFTRINDDYLKNTLEREYFRYGTSSSLDIQYCISDWISPFVGFEYSYLGRLQTENERLLVFLPDGTMRIFTLRVGLEIKI